MKLRPNLIPCILLWIVSVVNAAAANSPAQPAAIRSEVFVGEFGGDMAFLRSFYTAPCKEDGNHYVEMWRPNAGIREITRVCGLTNNRALFVNSHGDTVQTIGGIRYGFRPHQSRFSEQELVPSYSVRDIYTLMGPAAAANIHNVCLSGCNLDGQFNAGEIRQYFPNATNITHVAAGESGFEPMFIQALTLPSTEIRPLFETAQKKRSGEMAYSLGHSAVPNALRLPPYVADIFLPGAKQPFQTRIAGRELLDPVPQRRP